MLKLTVPPICKPQGTRLLFSLLLVVGTCLAATSGALCDEKAAAPRPREGHDPALARYVAFIKAHGQDPLEYVIDLFKTHDVVILAERDHRESTQWEFIYRLLEDPRFNSQVGHLFTEYGSVTQQGDLEEFLAGERPDEGRILGMLRNFILWPEGWNRNNLFTFFKRFHALNKRLDESHRIRWYFSDIPWKWEGMTKAEYQAQNQSTLSVRDEVMAGRIRTRLTGILQSQAPRRKALIIMNTRHAFRTPLARDGKCYGDNVGSALARCQPTSGRTAFVMLNFVNRQRRPGQDASIEMPVQGGRWDAAFAALGNAPRAVTFHDSPFGGDDFDYLGFGVMKVRYRDVFDGMVFYEPLTRHRIAENIPGFYDEAFCTIVRKRALLNDSVQEMEDLWKAMRDHPERYNDRPAYRPEIMETVHKWLELQEPRPRSTPR